MGVVDATTQVEKIRSVVQNDSFAVQSMLPPSYLYSLLYDGVTSVDRPENIILVYKLGSSASGSELPIAYEPDMNETSDLDLTGQPLECPFENDEFDDSVFNEKCHMWNKAELSQLPISLKEAGMLLNHISRENRNIELDDEPLLDVWVLTTTGAKKTAPIKKLESSLLNLSTQEKTEIIQVDGKKDLGVTVLLGISSSDDKWWTRSMGSTQRSCSLEAPGMNPEVMKQNFLKVSALPASLIKSEVLCRYNVCGRRINADPSMDFTNLTSVSSVSLELKWRRLCKTVPFEEATTSVLTQAVVGAQSSPAHALWLELSLLQKLLDVLLTCWRDKTAPQSIPHSQLTNSDEPLKERLQTLMRGGGMALQAKTAEARMSLAPSLLACQSMAPRQSIAPGFADRNSMAPRQSIAPGFADRNSMAPRQSIAPGFLGRRSMAPKSNSSEDEEKTRTSRSLKETLELATVGSRENSDSTDHLWTLLSECKTYDELTELWELIFHEVAHSGWMPYLRSKNSTRAAKLIQGLASGQIDNEPELWQLKGSGVLQPLELLLELGLEKLTADFYYIFLDSELVGRNALQPPQMPRSGLGVSRDMWLSRCGQLLGWLAQVYTALELLLALPESLPFSTLTAIASETVQYFQSKESPVRSVTGLSSGFGRFHEFRCQVNTRDVQHLLTDHFDWWRLTLSSETENRRVKSVFLRKRSDPIFPPPLFPNDTTLVSGAEDIQYCCAEVTIISDLLTV